LDGGREEGQEEEENHHRLHRQRGENQRIKVRSDVSREVAERSGAKKSHTESVSK